MAQFEPSFKRKVDGSLVLSDSSQALLVRQEHRERAYQKPESAEIIRKRAIAKVKQQNGDATEKKNILSQWTIEFGQFRKETFQWLLTNALGYAAFLVVSSEKDKPSAEARWLNKQALKNFMSFFPEAVEAIELKRKEKKTPKLPRADKDSLTMSDTSDSELMEAAAQLEKTVQDPQLKVSAKQATSPKSSNENSSKSKKSSDDTLPEKKVRSVSGAPKKTIREQFLSRSPEPDSERYSQPVAVPSETPKETLTLSEPIQRKQQPSDSQVPLLKKWRISLPTVDQEWISSALFVKSQHGHGDARLDISKITSMWISPPGPPFSVQSAPKLYSFFGQRVFLWMPVKLWGLKISCPHANCSCTELSYSGLYPVVRQVLGISSFYNLASETLICKMCKRKMVSWSYSILSQIDVATRTYFPCLLTTMKACDNEVVILMRQRGLGNSASQLQKQLQELHSTYWHNRYLQYVNSCKQIKTASTLGLIQEKKFADPPAMSPVPQYRWLMQVYIQDVLQRLEEVKANITSVFGRVLKLDSTKKVTKKLAGPAAGTAEWATNVGNEYGQILMSILTSGEGRFGLHRMAQGLMKRYSGAGQPAPEVLYVDRDCCGRSCVSLLFSDWASTPIRLDVWHFMRRLSSGCQTDSHPLYGLFMQRLSRCIFAWDPSDLKALVAAKRAELTARHVPVLTDREVIKHISKGEFALHCRRVTRGTEETTRLISALIEAFDGDKGRDTLGTPLMNSHKMHEEWELQKRHVKCLQDPPEVQLYIQTGTLKKGGMTLPTFRCCRGSTSLENFHLHLNRFIPGTLANDTVFQAYLVDGLSRWNQDRASAISDSSEPHTYSGLLRHTANQLTEEIFGKKLSGYTPPRKYTGELIGIEYLYDQTGRPLQEYSHEIEKMEDSGLDVPEEEEGLVEPEVGSLLNEDSFQPVPSEEDLGITTNDQERPILSSQESFQSEPRVEDPEAISHTNRQRQISTSQESFQSEPHVEDPEAISHTNRQRQISTSQDEQFEPPRELTPAILNYPTDQDYQEMYTAHPVDDSVGPDHIPGFASVQALASYLAELRGSNLFLTADQAAEIVRHWSALSEYDKRPIVFNPLFAKHSRGRFRAKRQAPAGVESTERSMRGPDSVPATRPDCCRYVEALIDRLCTLFPGSRRRQGHTWSRWSLILEAYSNIRRTILTCAAVTTNCSIQLPEINQKTLKAWYNDKARDMTRQVLYQGINLPEASLTTAEAAPPPVTQPSVTQPKISGLNVSHQYSLPPLQTVSQPPVKKQRLEPKQPAETSVAPTLTTMASPVVVPMPLVSVPYTTQQYRKKKAKEESMGLHRRPYTKKKVIRNCKKCGQPIEKPSHINYFGNLFCQNSEKVEFNEWKQQFEHKKYGQKK